MHSLRGIQDNYLDYWKIFVSAGCTNLILRRKICFFKRSRGYCLKKVLLRISRNLREKTCARIFFKKKILYYFFYFSKNKTLAQLFSCEYCKIFKNAFFTENLRGEFLCLFLNESNTSSLLLNLSHLCFLNLKVNRIQ